MLCGRLSLLTNSTRVPCAMVSVFGLAPLDVTVIVRPSAPPGDGPEGGEFEPPQADTRQQMIARGALRTYFPVNFGFRFSRNAAAPSALSADA